MEEEVDFLLSDLDIRHYIDVMHMEKNVCDSVIGTLLNIHDHGPLGWTFRSNMSSA